MWKVYISAFILWALFAYGCISLYNKRMDEQRSRQIACEADCGIRRNMIANGFCFCMTENGWVEDR